MINSLKLSIRPRRSGAVAWLWAIPVLLAVSPFLSLAEEAMELASPAPASDQAPPLAGPDWASMTEPEIREHLAEVRTEFVQTRRDLQQLQTRLEQDGRAKDLLDEITRLRREIGLLNEQAEQSPENADALENQARPVRQALYAKEAERLGLLDQSDEYRALSTREGDLREQLRAVLQKLQELSPEDSAARTD
jgi:hypothetical protein